jgi:hypothetical protein
MAAAWRLFPTAMTCSSRTTPAPKTLFLHRRGKAGPIFPGQPWPTKKDVAAAVPFMATLFVDWALYAESLGPELGCHDPYHQ